MEQNIYQMSLIITGIINLVMGTYLLFGGHQLQRRCQVSVYVAANLRQVTLHAVTILMVDNL